MPYADLGKYWDGEDEGARILLTLTFFYVSETGTEWTEESLVPNFKTGRKNKAKRSAPYIDHLTKKQKTDLTIECDGKAFPVHKLVLSSEYPY